MMKNALMIPVLGLVMFGNTVHAEPWKTGANEGTSWVVVDTADRKDMITVAALSTNGEKEMLFRFEDFLGQQLFLGVFDVPVETCGETELGFPNPNPDEYVTVNGADYSFFKKCKEGQMQYSLHPYAVYEITDTLMSGEDVMLAFSYQNGEASSQTWEAEAFFELVGDKVEAFKESSNYMPN